MNVPVGEDAPILVVMRTMRAMRRLKPDPVPDELLEQLAEAATWAPSGSNEQAYEFINFWLEPATQRAWSQAYFCSPGRGDIGDWPKEFAESQIVTPKQFENVKLPDLEAIGSKRKDWTLRWQEVMA